MAYQVQYVPHAQIDKQRWDVCINTAANGLLYAKSDWLDALSPGWDGLILDDYRLVMPLPWKKKWGIRYLYQSFGIAQGGVFGPVNPQIEQAFLQKMLQHFRFGTIDLNESSQLSNYPNVIVTRRTNFVLPLQKSYIEISAAYNKDGKKNLRRAAEFDQRVINNVPISKIVELYKAQYGELNSSNAEDYARFTAIAETYIAKELAFTIGIVNPENELLAAGIFGKSNQRLYYLLGAPSAVGKTQKSTHVLIDAVIKIYSESNYSLDFEGSDIDSVATFYKKFSPERKEYPQLYFNRLPFFLRWLKR